MRNVLLVSCIALSLVACDSNKKALDSDISSPSVKPDAQKILASKIAKEESAIAENPMKEAYFGETHIHTALSLDALIGGAKLMPDDAYKFAQGKTVLVNGEKHSIGRPLDFVALTDHSEYIGESYSAIVPGSIGHEQDTLKELRGLQTNEEKEAWFKKYVQDNNRSGKPSHPPFWKGDVVTKSAWKMMVDSAQENYKPGKFTTIPAFEWTAVYKGGNLHRNVFFRDTIVPDMPISAIEAYREDSLWKWMVAQQAKGSTLFAIPHNSNASKGFMFGGMDGQGKPYDADYAELRSKLEPLVEMMQVKGNSEVTQAFWQSDEFAGFENAKSITDYSGRTFEPNDFVRWALIQGLDYKVKLGTNPFKLGFVGGTDNHNGVPSDVSENNFIGGHGAADNTPELRRTGEITGWITGRDENPGAITGVWATKNTRGAIFDSMMERETFATSGPRMKVRFFGGFDLPEHPADVNDLVSDGYSKGVPMGQTLTSSENDLNKSPTFTVYAQKDPEGANLDRIQIIKGWIGSDGEHKERIINVAWSGSRKIGVDGTLPKVGNTVDVKNARYKNTIGATTLMGTWTDEQFDVKQNALYYVRVLEIPTPRWTTYEAVKNKLPLLEDVPATIQERAWASPIWYDASK